MQVFYGEFVGERISDLHFLHDIYNIDKQLLQESWKCSNSHVSNRMSFFEYVIELSDNEWMEKLLEILAVQTNRLFR